MSLAMLDCAAGCVLLVACWRMEVVVDMVTGK